MKKLCCALAMVAVSQVALAQDKAAPPPASPPGAAPGMDMSKVGPMSRPVTKEDKKGIEEFFKASDEAWRTGNLDALLELMDFPLIMMSDDSKGAVGHYSANKEQWAQMMRPMLAGMPKDMKLKQKRTPTFLSDTLAVVVEETSMSLGKVKGKWKGFCVLNKKEDGKWKVKQMAEAGWGDIKPPGAQAAAK